MGQHSVTHSNNARLQGPRVVCFRLFGIPQLIFASSPGAQDENSLLGQLGGGRVAGLWLPVAHLLKLPSRTGCPSVHIWKPAVTQPPRLPWRYSITGADGFQRDWGKPPEQSGVPGSHREAAHNGGRERAPGRGDAGPARRLAAVGRQRVPDAGQPGEPGQPNGPFGAGLLGPSGCPGAGPGAAQHPPHSVGSAANPPGRQEHRSGDSGELGEGAGKLASCVLLVGMLEIWFGSHRCYKEKPQQKLKTFLLTKNTTFRLGRNTCFQLNLQIRSVFFSPKFNYSTYKDRGEKKLLFTIENSYC